MGDGIGGIAVFEHPPIEEVLYEGEYFGFVDIRQLALQKLLGDKASGTGCVYHSLEHRAHHGDAFRVVCHFLNHFVQIGIEDGLRSA